MRAITLFFLAILASTSASADQLAPYARYEINHPAIVGLDRETQTQLKCMALNIYYESRGTSHNMQSRVAWVTKNRLRTGRHGRTICEVVFERRGGYAQWTWTKTQPRAKFEPASWHLAQQIAHGVYAGKISDVTNGGLYFMEKGAKVVKRQKKRSGNS